MKRQSKTANNGHAEGFPQRLVTVRKERNLTQQPLADTVRCALTQLKRYESGASQPTLDVIKRLAQALGVSSGYLLFGNGCRRFRCLRSLCYRLCWNSKVIAARRPAEKI